MLQVIYVLGLAVISFFAVSASGDENEELARAAFNEGVDHYNAERYEEALDAFVRANSLRPNWKLLYNIGQCHAVLKQYGLAIDAFEQYLAEGGDQVTMERRDEVLSELEPLRQMVGTVIFDGPDGVDVYVDGAKRATTPMAAGILVQAGIVHEFRFERSGEVVGTRTERVRGGMSLTLEVPGREARDAPSDVHKTGEGIDGAPEDAGLHPAFFWTGIGLTAAFAGGLLTMDLLAKDAGEEAKTEGDLDAVHGMQITGIVFLGMTGAAAVTTVVLAFFTDFDRDREAPPSVSLGPWTTGNATGLSMGGSF